MHPFFLKLQKVNSRLLPYALVLLLVIIFVELAHPTDNPAVRLSLQIADYFIIAIFIIDLFFIARKCKSFRYFFKNYYLDILAVFPFALLFRFLGEFIRFLRIGEEAALTQSIVHEALEAEKVVKTEKVLGLEKEAKVLTSTEKLSKFSRLAARSLRVVTKSRLFTKYIRPEKRKEEKKARDKKRNKKK